MIEERGGGRGGKKGGIEERGGGKGGKKGGIEGKGGGRGGKKRWKRRKGDKIACLHTSSNTSGIMWLVKFHFTKHTTDKE